MTLKEVKMKMYFNSVAKQSVAFFLITVPAASNAFLIDDFRPINFSNNIDLQGPIPDRSFVAAQTGGMLSGERDVELFVTSRNDAPNRYIAGYGDFRGATEYRVGGIGAGGAFLREDCRFTLQYDGTDDETGNTGFGRTLSSGSAGGPLLPSGVGGIRLWTDRDGLSYMEGTVYLGRQGSIIAQLTQAIDPGVTGFEPTLFAFEENVLAVTDSITVEIFIPAIHDEEKFLYISHIDTIVPEPTGLIPLGAGFAWLLVRRRRVGKP